jgi:16S rRNA (adenine1518-N6/adenine1519-N6)-dimethyltransferase
MISKYGRCTSLDTKPFAKRSLGQNFLQDENTARRIVATLSPSRADTLFEIGPGRGALTRWLYESRPAMLRLLELDNDLAEDLELAFPGVNLDLGDALKFPWESLEGTEHLKLVGNLPYNVASPLMWEIVSRLRGFELAVFMVQYEVGLRLSAKPGSKLYGALSAWIQSYTDVRLLFKVPPTVFKPRPKVDSAVLSFVPRPGSPMCSRESLAKILHVCFQKRRKQLRRILKDHFPLFTDEGFAICGIDPQARPETLSPETFQRLAGQVWRLYETI